MRRTARWAAVAWVAAWPTVLAERLLLPGSDAERPRAVWFQTAAGTTTAAARPVSVTRVKHILLAPSLFQQERLKALTAQLSALVAAEAEPVVLATATGTDEAAEVSVKNKAEVPSALRTLNAAVTGDGQNGAAAVSWVGLMKLLQRVASPPEEWGVVVYIGAEPAVPDGTQAFANGLLARIIAQRRIRFIHASDEAAEGGWAETIRAAGGDIIQENLEAIAEMRTIQFADVELPALEWKEGFLVKRIGVRVDRSTPRQLPWIWSAPEKPLPDLGAYAGFLKGKKQLAAGQPSLEDVEKLLAFNPVDVDLLKLAAAVSERHNDLKRAASYADRLLAIEPNDGAFWSKLAGWSYKVQAFDKAESAFLKARELGVDEPQTAELLGDIRFAKADADAAAGYYKEAIKREPSRRDLWKKVAEAYRRARKRAEYAAALEQVLAGERGLWEDRHALIEYYLEVKDSAAARRHVDSGIAALPADLQLTREYARYAELVGDRPKAITLWEQALNLGTVSTEDRLSLATLYKQERQWPKALAAAQAGIEAAPPAAGSPEKAVSTRDRLAVVMTDALLATNRVEEARRELRKWAGTIRDGKLLETAAELEDRYGGHAAGVYRAAAEAEEKRGERGPRLHSLLENGLRTAIEEERGADCEWFAARLRVDSCRPAATGHDAVTTVPGGHEAALFMARGPEQSSPEAFLADFSRTVSVQMSGRGPAQDAFRARMVEYFAVLADLMNVGRRNGAKVTVRLSLNDRNSAKATERVLALIGWRVRRQNGKPVVEPAVEGKRTRRQDLPSALAIDLLSMQEKLQNGQEFEADLIDERVNVFPPEQAWSQQFYPGQRFAGGVAEAMARYPDMAALYAALANMERSSAEALVDAIGLKRLAEHYGRLLGLYSSCLQIAGGRVDVPGGDIAAAVWAELLNAGPSDPRKFFRALLDKDDGKLLQFYFRISQLDTRRQRFFTASLRRTRAFYESFRNSEQGQGKRARLFGMASLEDLFRELPIDADGRLELPGGPEVWMVAKNRSNSVAKTEKRLNKLSRVTTPEVEDEILLRLIADDYKQDNIRFEVWQNLLAVVRVEAARTEPLDENSALLLAENFVKTQSLYGYFTHLRRLTANHYREIFRFAGKLRQFDDKGANVAAGLFHSMLYLYAMAEELGKLDSERTAALALPWLTAVNQANSIGELTRAALDALNAYRDATGTREAVSLREVLSTVPEAWRAEVHAQTVEPGKKRRANYERVLELQNVPALDELSKLHGALKGLSQADESAWRQHAEVIATITQRWKPSTARESKGLPEELRKVLEAESGNRIAALNRQLAKQTAAKGRPKDLAKLAGEYWDSIAFRTLVGLAGQAYAAHFSADDLVIADDPFFLRKHQFAAKSSNESEYFSPGGLRVTSEGAGSHAFGGFDGIPAMAGRAAATALRGEGPMAVSVAAAVLGTVRTTNWRGVRAEDLRAMTVQVRAAQDWLTLAAADVRIREAVASASSGLVSLSRRARLLAGLERHDWAVVWSSLSLTDLWFLGGRLKAMKLAAEKATPAIREHQSQANAPGTRFLGVAAPTLRRTMTPVLLELPPYEDTAAGRYPDYLAERLAEFTLYLARVAAQEALPPEVLPAVAESAARAVLAEMRMADVRDWPGALAAYRAFDGERLKDALGELK
ncbi:MAG: hypothetical protein IT168_24645 [Bryobacterales bacterium]|nr:hypothetical protein [Bryobacterales bacterium]